MEHAIEQLHADARSGADAREFYRELLTHAGRALDAFGGAAWQVAERERGAPQLMCEWPNEGRVGVGLDIAARRDLIREAIAEARPIGRGASDAIEILATPILESKAVDPNSAAVRAVGVLELWLPATASSADKQSQHDFAAALADVAADFHAFDQLRRLRQGSPPQRDAVELLRRLSRVRTLDEAAFEVVNDGRRLVVCDRLALGVIRRGAAKLLAVSGVDAIDPRGDFARRIESLASQAAQWGEPLQYGGHADHAELPPQLAATLERYVDQSRVRHLVCVPVALAEQQESGATTKPCATAVLVGERFSEADAPERLQSQLVELGELVAPALARAQELSRFPTSLVLSATRRAADNLSPVGAYKRLAWLAVLATALAALRFIPADFTVEAPATVHANVEREVFAPATGAIAEVRVKHGQRVVAGDVLAVIRDPELSLKRQQVLGEIETLRNRWAALAVTRTDRSFREDPAASDRLPLAAEQRQIEQQLASLERQRDLLDQRHEALTIRSPIAGDVLTRDVESLLASRPVERGQILMTIADAKSGWQLDAETPQRHMEAVIAALADAEKSGEPLRVSYRLSSDVARTYEGRVAEIAAAAPLDAANLRDDAPPVLVRIATEGDVAAAARPGMTATVQIHCGSRPLGYVWLHDAWATIFRWATF